MGLKKMHRPSRGYPVHGIRVVITLVVLMLAFSMALGDEIMDTKAQSDQPDPWYRYVDQLRTRAGFIEETLGYDDEKWRAEGNRHLMMQLSIAYPLIFNDVDHPEL